MKTFLPKAQLACLLLFSGLSCLARPVQIGIDNFDDGSSGKMPAGWQVFITGTGAAQWVLERDVSAPSAPLVLKQTGWAPNPSYPHCVKRDAALKNGFAEVQFKPLSGTNDQAAGLVWRYQDTNNYYVVRANALESNVVLYKVADGKRKALDIVGRQGGYGVKAEVPAQKWSTLRVEFVGTRFRVLLNGNELFLVEDATFSDKGAVGVWTKADSVTAFDDFSSGELK
jgi:hypothetical protein